MREYILWMLVVAMISYVLGLFAGYNVGIDEGKRRVRARLSNEADDNIQN